MLDLPNKEMEITAMRIQHSSHEAFQGNAHCLQGTFQLASGQSLTALHFIQKNLPGQYNIDAQQNPLPRESSLSLRDTRKQDDQSLMRIAPSQRISTVQHPNQRTKQVHFKTPSQQLPYRNGLQNPPFLPLYTGVQRESVAFSFREQLRAIT